jgi:hypothetical protein
LREKEEYRRQKTGVRIKEEKTETGDRKKDTVNDLQILMPGDVSITQRRTK